MVHEVERERLLPVEWGQTDALYPVNIHVEAWDRLGLMRDITTVVAEEKVSIASVNLTNHDGHTISTFLTLGTSGLAQLSRLLKKIEAVKGVKSVIRVGNEAAKKAGPKTG